MGLDMYLTKRTYVKNWEHQKPEEKHSILVKRGGKVRDDIKPERIEYVIEEVGYWRKANAIHAWFVKNVQKGNDDCGDYYVDQQQLRDLLADVNEVLDSVEMVKGQIVNGYSYGKKGEKIPNFVDGKYLKDISVAAERLPTQEGFFFGSTAYDQWYVDDLKATKKILEAALSESGGEFYYHSSW